jgi:hypothetical protein
MLRPLIPPDQKIFAGTDSGNSRGRTWLPIRLSAWIVFVARVALMRCQASAAASKSLFSVMPVTAKLVFVLKYDRFYNRKK